MISLPLLRATIKSNYIIWLIFAAILAMYFSIIASMYNPATMEGLDAMLATLPPQLVDAMNFKTSDPSLLGFLAGYFYGFLILLFPMVYTVIMADRMVARFVDSGSMAFLLSTPNTRAKIALTQAIFLAGSMALLILFVTLIGLAISQAMFPGLLDVGGFLLLNVGAILLYFALSGIGFFASCLFNQSKHSLGLGGGLLTAFFLINMLANVDEKLAGLKYLTLLSLFNSTEIITGGSSVLPALVALAFLGLLLYASGIFIFSKKDLPI